MVTRASSTANDKRVRARVTRKLHPTRVRVSGKFTALLAFLLDADPRWTDPGISDLTITSDGLLIDSSSGFANDIIGDVGDLERNIRGVAKVAELTPAETRWLLDQIPRYAHDWRHS